MNKRKILLRLLVSPFILGLLMVTYSYGCIKQWFKFIRYGGEWINYEKDEYKTIKDVYELIKKDNPLTQ